MKESNIAHLKSFSSNRVENIKLKNEEFSLELPYENFSNSNNFNFRCGLYYSDLTLAEKVLKEADLILDFKAVKEVWVPIEGKVTKLYIFEAR